MVYNFKALSLLVNVNSYLNSLLRFMWCKNSTIIESSNTGFEGVNPKGGNFLTHFFSTVSKWSTV